MTRLGAVMCEAIIHHYGRDELLRRLAHPFWFQSFGAVMGMDWHSSGITTSVIGALKRGLKPLAGELGIHVCGGRGKHSRKTPHELIAIGERVGFDGAALASASRLVAKVDSAAVQDGFDLYLHGFIVTDDGHWVVVQQGMNGDSRQARRYHWLSEGLTSFVDEPHAAIEGTGQGEIVNLTDHRAGPSRQVQLDLLRDLGPDRIVREFAVLEAATASGDPSAAAAAASGHAGASRCARRATSSCAACTATSPPRPNAGRPIFPSCCWCPGVGARTVRALAHGGRSRAWRALPLLRSGALFARAWRQGPAPVSGAAEVYDETIGVLKSAVGRPSSAATKNSARCKRLDDQARRLERYVTGPSLKEIVAGEFDQSHLLGGRSVFGWESPPQDLPARLGRTPSRWRRSLVRAGQTGSPSERWNRIAAMVIVRKHPSVADDNVTLAETPP